MKKKIGDLTHKEAHEICRNRKCDNCPISNVIDDECMFIDIDSGHYLDEEIEVQE